MKVPLDYECVETFYGENYVQQWIDIDNDNDEDILRYCFTSLISISVSFNSAKTEVFADDQNDTII